jgi:class 3 adenylate cyclase
MVLAILNEYFVCLDVLIENYSSNGCLTKIKTIGTKYLLAGNVLKHSDNHLYDMACIALHILKTFDPDVFFQEVDYRKEKTKLELKMGIAVGPLVTGICGSKKFLWDIWGDTCNMASRMQTTLIGSGIQITEAVYERLKNDFTFSDKMSTNIKGKGKTTTYLLLDYKSENTQDKKKKSITQTMINGIKTESSNSSISQYDFDLLKKKTNKCMADDGDKNININKVKAGFSEKSDANSLTYEILNDSDFEDDNNSFSNSTLNIFGLNPLNGARSQNDMKKSDVKIQTRLNSEIALNLNQQIQNVILNYDQIQNLQNITNESMNSLHNDEIRNTNYLSEDNASISSNNINDEEFNDQKPSLIKGILNRTKSYQFKRANSSRPKDFDMIQPSPSHKNFALYNLKHGQNNDSFHSYEYSPNNTDNPNLSVDCLSEFGSGIENKLVKNVKKKKSIFKSFHSIKQKSENNLTKLSSKISSNNIGEAMFINMSQSNIKNSLNNLNRSNMSFAVSNPALSNGSGNSMKINYFSKNEGDSEGYGDNQSFSINSNIHSSTNITTKFNNISPKASDNNIEEGGESSDVLREMRQKSCFSPKSMNLQEFLTS